MSLQLAITVVASVAQKLAETEGGDSGAEQCSCLGEAVTHGGGDGGDGMVEEIVEDVSEGGSNDKGTEQHGDFLAEIVAHPAQRRKHATPEQICGDRARGLVAVSRHRCKFPRRP